MRVLLDECVPIQVKSSLIGHDVRTVGRMGWAGKKNGELLRLAETRFDVFITVDRSLKQQQNLFSTISNCQSGLITHEECEGVVEQGDAPDERLTRPRIRADGARK